MADDNKRKAHVFRIYKDDDQTSDVWVDIERIDALIFETGSGKDYRKWYYEYDWDKFDPKDPDIAEYKYITNPDDGPSVEVSTAPPAGGKDYIKVPIRKALTVESGSGPQFQRTIHTHENGSSVDQETTRKVHVRKVIHYDVPKERQDADGQPPSDPKGYFNALDVESKDESQYVEVEVIDELITTTGSGYTWRKWFWSLSSDGDALLADPIGDQGAFPIGPRK
jgi:hypothetical protein